MDHNRIYKEQKKVFLHGSATIEASMIIPFILVIFVIIISVTFFLYDECTAWQCSYLAALRGDTETGQTAQKELWAEYFAKKLFSQELMAATDIEFSQTRKGDKLTVYAKGSVSGRTIHSFSAEKWNFETAGTVELLRPVQFIRRIQFAKELVEKVKGGAQKDGL